MSNDFRGDPSAAMLEVLDPAQNKNFGDHYIEVEYDLSKVMFIMTANDLGKIPGPLRDRMEIINIAGYTPNEKLQIAKKYLIKRAQKQNGLDEYTIQVSDKAFMKVVRGYTREAGVRGLERAMNTICRKIATEVVTKDIAVGKKFSVSEKTVEKHLGPVKIEGTDIEQAPQVGLVNGLAWTSAGGDLLHIEVVTTPGKGRIVVTGKLGEVMQESSKAAFSYVKSISSQIGIDHEWYEKNDIHVHVPDGSTPKDGPSAGITMATAFASAITGIPVKQDVAMTGEISLRGRVMPIGGLKEKILAAKQAGVKTVVIPQKNAKDLVKIPDEILSGVEVIPVSQASEVLKIALELANPEEFFKVVAPLHVVSGETSASHGVAN
jgi:ATP-dependent Lon protease